MSPRPPARAHPLLAFVLAFAVRDALAQEGGEPPAEAGPAHIGFYVRALQDLGEPTAAAIASNGRIVIAESALGALALFDAEGVLVKRISLRDAGALVEPAGVACGADGRIYWTDANGARVHVIDAEGAELARFGDPGLAPGKLHRPRGIDVANDRIAVADAGNHKVELFALDGKHLATLGGHGRAPGHMIRPADVAFAADGSIFVADEGNARVQRFDAEGRFVRAWGDFGAFPGLFSGPTAIEVRGPRVFVCDRANHRVQVFDLEGKHLYEFGEHAVLPFQAHGRMQYPSGLAVSADGDLALVTEGNDDRAQLFTNDAERSTGERLVPRPPVSSVTSHYGEAVAVSGAWLAITAPEDHTVLVFEASLDEPRLVAHAGELGDGPGLFLRPEGVWLDGASGTLAVTDIDRRTLSLFHLTGFEGRAVGYDAFVHRFVKELDFARMHSGLPAGTLEEVPDPGAITRDDAGRYYVCDLRNDCVLVLDADLSFVRRLGARGIGPSEMRRPTSLALARDGSSLLAVDSGNARVHSIELESGEFATNGRNCTTPGPAGMASVWPYALAPDLAADERAPKLFGIAAVRGADSQEPAAVYVTDAARDRVLVLAAYGLRSTEHGATGLGRVQFREPRGLALDAKGRLVAIDHANHRAQVLSRGGEYIGVFGSRPFLEPALFPNRKARGESEDE